MQDTNSQTNASAATTAQMTSSSGARAKRQFIRLSAEGAAHWMLTQMCGVSTRKVNDWVACWLAAHHGKWPQTPAQQLGHALLAQCAVHGFGAHSIGRFIAAIHRTQLGSLNLAGFRE